MNAGATGTQGPPDGRMAHGWDSGAAGAAVQPGPRADLREEEDFIKIASYKGLAAGVWPAMKPLCEVS